MKSRPPRAIAQLCVVHTRLVPGMHPPPTGCSVSTALCLDLLSQQFIAVMKPGSDTEHRQRMLDTVSVAVPFHVCGCSFLGHRRGFVERREGMAADGNAEKREPH